MKVNPNQNFNCIIFIDCKSEFLSQSLTPILMFHQCMIIVGVFHTGRMNRPITKLKTTQSKQEYIETDDPSSKDCGSGERNVHSGPTGIAFWEGPPSDVSPPEIVPHHDQHTIQPGMVDPLSLRYTSNSFTIFESFESVLSFLSVFLFSFFVNYQNESHAIFFSYLIYTVVYTVSLQIDCRFHCPCQSTQCQITYPDYLLEPQSTQYHPLTGYVTVCGREVLCLESYSDFRYTCFFQHCAWSTIQQPS